MKLVLSNLRVRLDKKETTMQEIVAAELDISSSALRSLRVLRESVDARKKGAVSLVYNLELELDLSPKQLERVLKHNPALKKVRPLNQSTLQKGSLTLNHPPVVVGAGPAGYFAALTLAEWGYAPILLERGDDVDTRTSKVNTFWQVGELDPESNVQFGEGGAGTFSDGKLTTRIDDLRINYVLQTLTANGAPEEILYKQKPHIGTDRLRQVVKELRGQVERAGGQVRFRSKLTGIKFELGKVAAIEINGSEELPAEAIVLAIGHSARDTYFMLRGLGLALEPKSFAIGLRVEHPQVMINEAQYGLQASHPRLGQADYQLAYKDLETGRGAYAFCMCPGGKVVGAASEKGGVVTNGMSEYARDSSYANSAVVVTVNPQDFPNGDSLGGIEFQRIWEKKAYELGGCDYSAPVQSVEDFLGDRKGTLPSLTPSYMPGVVAANLRDSLPKEVGLVLTRALVDFNRKISGFSDSSSALTGVETRTSAPLRILRDHSMQCIGFSGLYPAGEGAGYAGGIMSAAIDGIKAAEAVINKYASVERRN